MHRRSFAPLALALAVGVAAAPAIAADEAEVQRIRAQAQAMQKRVEAIRKLSFTAPVKTGVQDRAQLRAFVLEELAKETPDEKVRALEKAYAKIGFLPHGFDLKKCLVDLYTEQIAGFYDPEKKELFLIEHGGPEQDMVMAHELTHALQDQNFDLFKMHKAIEKNDDRALALTSIIEGDATVVMVVYLLHEQAGVKIDPRAIPDIGMIMTNKLGSIMGGADPAQQALQNAPKVLSENLIFGYMQGASFCQRLLKESKESDNDAFEALSRAFRDPPTSTEQILHPEKYTGARRDEPIAVELPDLAEALGEGWKVLERNVMGEFNTALLFKEKLPMRESERAAEGWGGDAWQALEGPQGEVVFAWWTTWDTEHDAEEFAKTYMRFHEARGDGSELRIVRQEKAVAIVDGAGETAREAIAKVFREGVRTRAGYGETPAVVARSGERPSAAAEGPVVEGRPAAANPFGDVKAPEGWRAARRPGDWRGEGGARLRVVSAPAAGRTVGAELVRRKQALDRREGDGVRDYACLANDEAGTDEPSWERYTIEREGRRTRHAALHVLRDGAMHTVSVSAPEDAFDEAIDAVAAANPALAKDLRAAAGGAEAAPAGAGSGGRKREPRLF